MSVLSSTIYPLDHPALYTEIGMVSDVEEVCRNVNSKGATLPDGRRFVMALGERLRAHQFNEPIGKSRLSPTLNASVM
jgi:hypothetical protein